MENDEKERFEEKNKKLFIVLILLGIIIAIVALYALFHSGWDYFKSDRIYQNAAKEYIQSSDKSGNDQTESPWFDMIDVDFAGLKQINEDVAGWIYFENEDISYPVMYAGDNETYLHTTFNKEEASAGALFVDELNTPDFSDAHSLIYGHNMRNLSMFGRLKYYISDSDYYENHSYFQIITAEKKYRYKISSYKLVDADSDIYTIFKVSSDAFADFYKNSIESGANIKDKVTIDEDTRIITLSTCSADDKRLVVSAYLIDEY